MEIKQEQLDSVIKTEVKTELTKDRPQPRKSAMRSYIKGRSQSKVRFVDEAVKTEEAKHASRVKIELMEIAKAVEIKTVKSEIIELDRDQSTKEDNLKIEPDQSNDSVQIISQPGIVKTEADIKSLPKSKTVLGKRTRKERVKKFLEIEAEDYEDLSVKYGIEVVPTFIFTKVDVYLNKNILQNI